MALGAPPYIDPDTNGNPLLEWSKQNGQLHPALIPVVQKVLGSTVQPTTPTLAPPQAAPPPLTSPSAPHGPAAMAPTAPAPTAVPAPSPAPVSNTALSAAPNTPVKAEYDRLLRTGSGESQIKNPWARNTLKVLDAIGSAFLPSLTMGIPGTQLHHELLLNQARRGVTEEADVGKKEAETQRDLAEAANVGGEKGGQPKLITDPAGNVIGYEDKNGMHSKDDPNLPPEVKKILETAESRSKRPPEPHFEKGDDGTIYAFTHDPQTNKIVKETLIEGSGKGKPPQLSAEDRGWMKSAGGDPDDESTWTPEVMDKYREKKTQKPAGAGDDFNQFYAKWLKEKGVQDNATNEKRARAEWAQAAERPLQQPHQQYAVPDPKVPGGYRMIEVRPGGTIPPGAVSAQGVNAVNTPTTMMRNMAEMAQTVTQQAPRILSEVDALKEKLGAGVGRWNQLWVNRGGMNDPDFAGLDQDLDLYSSALVRTHFGARGGQQYREALRKNFSEAQSPDDLKARITHAEEWIEGYAKAGGKNVTPLPPQGGGKPAEGGYRIGGKYGGLVYQGGPVNDKASWK